MGEQLFHIDLIEILEVLVKVGLAYILAFPLGWERERKSNSAGLRTFPLVAMAACGYTLAGVEFLSSTEAEARVIQGIIAGMGFICGGAILKVKDQERERVSGTATAAGLWITGAIGMSIALNMLTIAIFLSLITFITMQAFHKVKAN